MIPELQTLRDIPDSALAGQAVLVRVDFNVPMDGGRILDESRIQAALPTLRELRQKGARVVVASHRGRPAGVPDPSLSLRPIADALGKLDLGPSPTKVRFVPEIVGPKARAAVTALEPGNLLVLENLRFDPREKACDESFSAQLAELASIYVSDAFGAVHRAHASTVGVAKKVHYRAAGLLIESEVAHLRRLLENPESPYLVLLGGAKISGKIDTLAHLVEFVDVLLLGGGLANTFLAARGLELGGSLVEQDKIEVAQKILDRCAERGVEVELPSDLVVTRDLGAAAPDSETVNLTSGTGALASQANPGGNKALLEADQSAVDVGPATVARYRQRIDQARTLFWNGPLGVFEKPPFDRGSLEIARAVAASPAFTVLGGGETGAVAQAAGVLHQVDHVSTGGGASLSFLAGHSLPGLEALAR